jgi:hypothetical protein
VLRQEREAYMALFAWGLLGVVFVAAIVQLFRA